MIINNKPFTITSYSKALFAIVCTCVLMCISHHYFVKAKVNHLINEGYEYSRFKLRQISTKHDEAHVFEENFLQGPLTFHTREYEVPFPDLSSKVFLISQNDRPDATDITSFLVGLKCSKENLQLNIGEKVYLNYANENEDTKLHFSEEKTPLWIQPMLRDQELYFLACLEVVDVCDRSTKQQYQEFFPAKIDFSGFLKPSKASANTYLQTLQEFKCFLPDRLIQNYGGDEFRQLKRKFRLVYEKDGKTSTTFVSETDCLIFFDDHWQLATPSEQTIGLPIAQIKSYDALNLYIDIWDDTGFQITKVSLPIEKPLGLSFCPEEIFAKIKRRTHRCVSCRLNNKPLILKKGDWLIHKQSGWSVLRNKEDITKVLQQFGQGELLVFDGIKKNHNHEHFVAKIFDKTRTVMQKLEIPLHHKSNKKNNKSQTQKVITNLDDDLDEELDEFEDLY